VKTSINAENFTHREKVGKTPRFSRERKCYIYYIYIRLFSLTVKGGKKGGLKRCPPSFLPLSFDK